VTTCGRASRGRVEFTSCVLFGTCKAPQVEAGPEVLQIFSWLLLSATPNMTTCGDKCAYYVTLKGTGQPDLVVWWLGSAFSPHVFGADDRASRGHIKMLTIIALDKSHVPRWH